MLLLTFRLAESLYAIAAEQVVEVVPRVDLRAIPHAPPFLAGLFSYRGTVVPVVDLGLLLGSEACRPQLDTRIILADEIGGRDGRRIGLIAEHVCDVRFVRDDQVVFPSMRLEEAPYLGPVVQTDEGLLQLISAGRVLPESLSESLYGQPAEVP